MFESRESCLNEILGALKDEAVHMIGVYGMPGIGKTTLVKEAANKAMNDGLFTEVVMVTVSQNLDVKRIQKDMAQCLGLHLDDNTTVDVGAGMIEERLMGKEGNRVLVILDDLWEMLELSKVRIPDLNDKGSTCRVVITTRREDVCNQMGCQKKVELRTLSDEESVIPEDTSVLPYLSLTREDRWNRSLNLRRTKQLPPPVKDFLEQIKTLGLVECRESEIIFNECDIPPHVFLNLEQLLVLRCLNLASLDFLIDVYNLGREKRRTLNLMNRGANSSDKSFDLMFQLKFMRVENCPKMARLLPSKVGKSKDILPLEKLEVRVCRSMLQLFPYDLDDKPMAMTKLLPKLKSLELEELPQLVSVLQPFQCLPSLRSLTISKCGLRRGLAYHEMEMAAADPFPKLVELKIFDCMEMSQMISSSSPDAPLQGMCIVFQNLCDLYVKRCPRLTHLFWSKQAKHMQHLKELKIFICDSLTAVVISNDYKPMAMTQVLPNLVDLHLWKLPQLESVLQPFQCLPNLKELRIRNCGLRCFLAYHEMEMVADPFPKLKVLVIDECMEMSQMISSSSPDPPLQGMCIVFKNLCDLTVRGCRRLTHLFWSKQAKHMQHLKELTIDDCESLTAVISNENQEQEGASTSTSTSTSATACMVVDHHGSHSFFPQLSTLKLSSLPQLESVLQPFQCLPNLKELRIANCGRCFLGYHEMEMVADPFPKLMKLVIEECMEMSQMISSSSPDPPLQGMCIVFKNLCDLIVEGCQRLTHLFWSKQAKHMQHLKELTIHDCKSLTAVISNENQEQEGASTSTSTSTSATACMVVDHHGSHSFFPRLSTLKLSSLPQLESVLQPFQCLPNLKELRIANCGLRCFLGYHHEMEMAADPFPKLMKLVIKECMEMSQMISSSSPDPPLQGMCIVFKNLFDLIVEGCQRLTHLFWSKQAKHMQHLKELTIRDCESLTAVISNESTSTSATACMVVDHHGSHSFFPLLTELNLSNLPQLESVLQLFQCLPNLTKLLIIRCGLRCGLAYHHEMEMATDPFPKLEKLQISGCSEMSQMISSSSSPDAPLQGMCIVFQNLRHLEVYRCPRLTHLIFWSKQAKHMQQLTSLEICDCESLTAVVISNENQEQEGASVSTSTSTSTTACMVVDHLGSHSFFPQLGKLRLYKLPKIVAFHQPTASLNEWSCLKGHFIRECPILEPTLLAITTRRQDVCNQMDWQKKVEIWTLSDEESWLLFKSRVGNVVESPTMKVVAWNVAKECAGQPLALVVLGTALKNKNLEVWKTVLKQLKKSTMAPVPVLQGVSNQLRESIELSYNFLESEEAKLCFLHCCLYPEDYDIEEDDLMHMLVGGGLLEDIDSLHEAQDRVHALMDQLKASGLLLEGSHGKSSVRMHYVVRDVALWIGEKDQYGFFVRAGQGLKDWPTDSTDVKKLQNCRRLSLKFNEIVDLPSDPIKCTKLETLILRGNRVLSNIPEKFFRHMKALKVLDLSFTNISCLPELLSCLTSLRVLNLKRCLKLRDRSPINWLRMFGILILEDIEGVSVISEDRGGLLNLRHVDLGKRVSVIPENTGRLLKWGLDDKGNRYMDLPITKQLRPSVKAFLEKIKILALVQCQESEITFNECDIPPRVFLNLEQLLVSNCKNLASFDFLIDVYNLGREKRRMLNLMNRGANFFDRAKHFYRANSSDKSFNLMFQLKFMRVENCPKMVRLLPSKVGKSKDILPLEKLEVRACSSMLQLFPYDFDHKPMAMTKLLPKLKSVELVGLPELKSVLQPFQCLPNLMKLKIRECGLMCGLAYHEMEMDATDPFRKLKELKILRCSKMSQMIFSSSPDALQGMCIFQNLCDLTVAKCRRLTHLFWSKQAKHMQQLTFLQIYNCKSLTAVVISNENQEEEASASTSTSTTTIACAVVDHHGSQCSFFPRLTRLILKRLPKFAAFHQSIASPMDRGGATWWS